MCPEAALTKAHRQGLGCPRAALLPDSPGVHSRLVQLLELQGFIPGLVASSLQPLSPSSRGVCVRVSLRPNVPLLTGTPAIGSGSTPSPVAQLSGSHWHRPYFHARPHPEGVGGGNFGGHPSISKYRLQGGDSGQRVHRGGPRPPTPGAGLPGCQEDPLCLHLDPGPRQGNRAPRAPSGVCVGWEFGGLDSTHVLVPMSLSQAGAERRPGMGGRLSMRGVLGCSQAFPH